MKITITGSLGNISKPLTKKLVSAGHQVTVISSNPANQKAIENLGALAAIGSIEDEGFLTKAFTGADVVYTMTPNNFGATDYRAYMAAVGKKYASALQKANIKNVVNLSSIGADLADGTGPIKGLHDVEHLLNELDGVNIKHLRAGFFYTNFYNDIPLIKNLCFTGSNYAATTSMILVHPIDIATAIVKQINDGFEGKSYEYVYSSIHTSSAVAGILGSAIGQPDLAWVQFTNEQALAGMLEAGLPPEISKNYVEMGVAMGDGSLSKDFNQQQDITAGKTTLEEFGKEFAARFNG